MNMEFIKPMELGHFYFSELAPIYETFIKNIYSTLSLVAVFHLLYFLIVNMNFPFKIISYITLFFIDHPVLPIVSLHRSMKYFSPQRVGAAAAVVHSLVESHS